MLIEKVSDSNSNGTGLIGYLPASITPAMVRARFGAPNAPAGDKVGPHWVLRFGSEVVATVYQWKGGKQFHVGGKGPIALKLVAEALGIREALTTWQGDPLGLA